MKTFNSTPLQFYTNDGIGIRLANAAAHKRLNASVTRAHACLPQPNPTGRVMEDVIALGSAALLTHVQQLLMHKPLEIIVESAMLTRIRVCGALDYVVDRNRKSVVSQPAALTGRERQSTQQPPWHHPFDYPIDTIDILNPLSRHSWLVHIAARPGWFGYALARHSSGQTQLFCEGDQMIQALSRVTLNVFNQLNRNQALIALRHKLTAALTLHIGPGLVNLAMRSRVQTDVQTLQARHLNLVWQHQNTFASMARENAHLLPLLTAWKMRPATRRERTPTDALPLIRHELLSSGLQPKAWRYLVRHGLKRLLPSRTTSSHWDTLIDTMKALNAARWPAPPPRGFLRLLVDSAGMPATFDLATCDGSPGWFWQMTCEEALARRGNARDYLEFFDRVPYLAWLVREFGLTPDQNQRRKKIAWLCEVAQRHSEGVPQDDTPEWGQWLQAIVWKSVTEFAVVPLLSRHAVLKEAIALHNCADSYVDDCRAEVRLLLSLRDHRTGKRVALACLDRNGDTWVLGEVAGPCNRFASLRVKTAAVQATGVVRYHHSQRSEAARQLRPAASNDDITDLHILYVDP
jgi:hypothetical protein